jgi:hypothetical protein
MTAINKSVYCWWKLLKGGDAVIDDLKASGFNTVIAWTIHILDDGDLVFNDTRLVSGGKYNPDSDPHMATWAGRLATLKKGGSVNRLLFGVGSAVWQGKNYDFRAIGRLIRAHGTGPDNPLYKNFAALRAALPAIDGIDFDNEDTYDVSSTVSFALMLKAMGYKEVTLCPYGSEHYWMESLAGIEAKHPGFVTTLFLQCYSGGSGNDPGDWIDSVEKVIRDRARAQAMVQPGLAGANNERDAGGGFCPDRFQEGFENWKEQSVGGGFLWRYDFIYNCAGRCDTTPTAAAYANAIAHGLKS